MNYYGHSRAHDRDQIPRLNQCYAHDGGYDDGYDGDGGYGSNCGDGDDDVDMVPSCDGDAIILQIDHELNEYACLSNQVVYDTSDDSDELRLCHHHRTSCHDRIVTDFLLCHLIR